MLVQTTLTAFKKTDFLSVREHDEFVWLHDRFVENEEYAGIIVSVCVCVCVCVLVCEILFVRYRLLLPNLISTSLVTSWPN